MLTEKDLCDYETCVALWELGCVTHPYDNTEIDKVLQIVHLYYAQKWLREEKNIYVTVGCPQIMNEGLGWSYEVCDKPWNGYSDDDCLKASGGAYDSYEEALLEGIKQSVKILKEKQYDARREADTQRSSRRTEGA